MAAIDDAVGLWRASEYSGSGNWLDESGNSYDMIPTGSPTFTSAGNDSYWDLSGSDQYFTTSGDVADFDFAAADSFTVAAVAAGDDDSSGGLPIITKKSSTSTAAGWMMYVNVGQVRGLIADGTLRTFNNPGPSMTVAERQLWVVRRNVSDDKLYANVDTTEQGETDTTTDTLATALDTRIGAFDPDGVNLNGKIYAGAIWRRGLTDAEVAGLEAELVPAATGGGNLLLLGVGG